MNSITDTRRSFGRCAAGKSIIYEPTTVDEVKQVFATACNSGKRVVIRGGGHSFDGQAVHDGDTGNQLILSTDSFETDKIEFDDGANTVTLGSGVKWRDFMDKSIGLARQNNGPIRLPGSMQTGGNATAGGTLSGDCLSRFSGIAGKESLWVDSFRILTPASAAPINVTAAGNPDLFYSVIGGQGYIGFVTDITYKLVAIDNASCTHTTITTHESFHDLIDKQIQLIHGNGAAGPRGISSAWFTDNPLAFLDPGSIKGGVFDSRFVKPSDPPLPGFPLYSGIHSDGRYWTEVMARIEPLNLLIHEALYGLVQGFHDFENDLTEFLFFMDGNTFAKEKYEALNKPDLFPIVQQTFVIPTNSTEAFAKNCVRKMIEHLVPPTECDMLFVRQDQCLMSANYQLDGFAVSFAFEPIAPGGCPPDNIPELLRELTVDCQQVGGRIHLTKNLCADRDVFRTMFAPQIERFENIKRQYDPQLLLQNKFSDTFFSF